MEWLGGGECALLFRSRPTPDHPYPYVLGLSFPKVFPIAIRSLPQARTPDVNKTNLRSLRERDASRSGLQITKVNPYPLMVNPYPLRVDPYPLRQAYRRVDIEG